MAVSNVLFVVLLGVFGAALAKPPAEVPTTAATTTVGFGNGTGTTPAGGVEDYLSDADKAKICEVKPATSNSTTPASVTPASVTHASTTPSSTTSGLCASVGSADDFCSKMAASVHGTSPRCVALNVCSFKTANATGGNSTAGTGSTIPGTGSTTAGTGSTTVAFTGDTGTTTAGNGTTTDGTGTGTTTADTGSTTADPAIVPEPNTAYVSCNTVPAGFQQIKTCPSGQTIFVYPAAAGSTTTFTIPKY
uniref:Uncharacterized protein n=1 Tax=Cacopsylla melanoneura TaxID=428564 RepID=A0A8D8U5I4_9HEMI